MSSVSLESGLGTLSFDGQVLEAFGFGEEGSRRFHVGQIQRIEVSEGGPLGSMFVVDVGPASPGLKMAMKMSDKDLAALRSLVDEVRAAQQGGST